MRAALLILTLGPAWGAPTCPQATPASSAPQCARAKEPVKVVARAPRAPATVAVAPPAAPAAPWKSVLDPLPAGGWKYISDGPAENPSSVYASTHNVLRDGNLVTAWMRWEFSHPQAEVYPLHYLSAVTREQLDCGSRSYRRAAVIYYTRNNLQEKGPSFTALDDDTTWKQAIPGSEADAMLNWGCPSPTERRASTAAKTALPAAAPSSAPAVVATPDLNLHTVR